MRARRKVVKGGSEMACGWRWGVVSETSASAQFREQQTVEYRESILIRTFTKKRSEVSEVVRKTRHDFHGKDYDLLSKNCNHFSDHLIYNLTNAAPPAEEDKRFGQHISKVASTAMGALEAC